MKKNVFLSLLFVLIQAISFSQLTVTTNAIATALAQNIAGNGVTISNATINCDPSGAGSFTYSGSNLGLTGGIILTTGYSSTAANSGSTQSSTVTGNSVSDPDLATITSGSLNDVCLVSFDFVPICNSLSLTFVFGSEEYPMYVNSAFNDAFGIFLTGPNPGGAAYSSQNIGALPNAVPVSINNVNAGTNSAYFHNNYTSPNSDIVFDGYTIPITSITPVSPCSTYHIKIAIADVGDGALDSGVLIQGNSLSCTNTPTVTTSVTAANCGNTGSATATVTNYTGTPTYQWLPGNATTPSITNIAAGTYTCLVGLQSGCGTTTQTVTAVVPSTGSTFVFTTNPQNPLCNNGTNGSIGVSITGGSAPYTYTWTTTPPQNTATTTATLPAGTYTLNMTDNAGCAGTKTVTLINPPAMAATVTTASTTCSANIGTATATVTTGGTGPFTYTWSNTQQTQTITGLASGTYSVLIADVNTCTATATGTVGGQGFTWSLAATSTNPKCLNSSDGTATVTVNNPGASTFTYSWTTTPAQTTNITTPNLSAGSYSVFVTDNNGCTSSASVSLVSPPAPTATINTTPTICNGAVGSATVTVLSGLTAPYNYTWITNPAQTGATASNLAQATYSVVITDANNCPLIDTGTVHSTGFTWTPVTSSSPTKCFGSADGTATVNITNPGNSTFTYTWMPSSQLSATANNLSLGVYTVTVEDNNNCVSTATTAITQPTQLVASTQSTPALCTSANGTAHATVFGGTPQYSYTWSITASPQNAQTAFGLTQGQYTILVTDANNCTVTATAVVGDTTDLKVSASTSPDLCSKGVGKAKANPTGQSPYTYTWTTSPMKNTQTADSLVVGTYSVNVTDANGCTASASATVINQDDILASQLFISPEGEIYAENPTVISISQNSGWNVDSANLSGSIPITIPSFNYVFPKYGDYIATYYYTSVNGCKDTVVYDIIVKDFITLYIPSAFTPNGDGTNDTFEAAGTFVNNFEMYIYDRWGILVTKLDDITKVWDGTKNGGRVPEDTYVYKGTASDVFGKHVSFQGQVNLIR